MVKTKNNTKTNIVNENRADIVRKELLNADGNIEHGYIDLALLAYEADKNEFYKKWGYSEFEDFVEKELKMGYRKLKYFIKIGKKVNDLKLSKEKLEELGWSKVSALTGVLKAENSEEWLKKAKDMSVRELVEAVKITRTNDPNSPIPKITTITLKLTESTAATILDAIETAKKLIDNDNQVLALEMVCSDWLEAQDSIPAKVSLEQKTAYIEKVYGVKVEIRALSEESVVNSAPINVEKENQLEDTIVKVTKANGEEDDNEIEDLLDDLLIEDSKDEQNFNKNTKIAVVDNELDELLRDV